jgi:dihydrofolate reductase
MEMSRIVGIVSTTFKEEQMQSKCKYSVYVSDTVVDVFIHLEDAIVRFAREVCKSLYILGVGAIVDGYSYQPTLKEYYVMVHHAQQPKAGDFPFLVRVQAGSPAHALVLASKVYTNTPMEVMAADQIRTL